MNEPIVTTHRVIVPAEPATEIGISKDECATLADVALAITCVVLSVTAIAACLFILHRLWGMV